MDQEPHRAPQTLKPTAVEVFSLAFSGDPLFQHFFPSPETRTKKAGQLFDVMVEVGLRHGELFTDGGGGMALLLPGAQARLPWGRLIACGGARLLPLGMATLRLSRFHRLALNMQEELMPGPHAYLQLLAVDPQAQGRGQGGALLRYLQYRLRDQRLPLYLETENPRNLPFYAYHGFSVLEETRLPRSSVTVWAMAWYPDQSLSP